MEALGKFFALLITLFISVLLSFLQTYIIISIAGMYDVDFITKLSFMQVFGILFIVSLAGYKINNEKNENKFSELIKRILTKIITMFFFIFSTMGSCFFDSKNCVLNYESQTFIVQ